MCALDAEKLARCVIDTEYEVSVVWESLPIILNRFYLCTTAPFALHQELWIL